MTRDRNAVLDRMGQALPSEGNAFDRLQDRRDRKVIRRRIGGASVGLGLTLAIVAALMFVPLDTGDAPDRIMGDSPVPLVAGPGEYYYSRGGSWYPEGDGVMTGQMWVGPDDSGRMLRGPGPVDSRSYGRKDQRFEAGDFPGAFVPELSTDPDQLLQQLIDAASTGQPLASSSPGRSEDRTKLLRSLQDLLVGNSLDDRFVVLTPEQRAALFQVASGLEEIAVEEEVADPYGRPAVRLSWVVDYGVGPGSRVLWYFEPTTGQFTGELWVNQRTGEIVAASLVEQAGITSSLDERPDSSASYVPEATGEPDLGPVELPPIGG